MSSDVLRRFSLPFSASPMTSWAVMLFETLTVGDVIPTGLPSMGAPGDAVLAPHPIKLDTRRGSMTQQATAMERFYNFIVSLALKVRSA